MFTRKLTKQMKWMMLLIVIPLYLYCGTIIASALIKFCIIQFSLNIDKNTATCFLNLILDSTFTIMGIWIFKDSLKTQFKDFFDNFKENMLYGIVIGTAIVYGLCIIGSLISFLLGAQSTSQNQSLIEALMIEHPVIILFTSVILAPIFEELLFRGTIFAWLYEVHPIVAHVVSSFLFGFLHVMNSVLSGNLSEFVQIFAYFFMGFALSYLYEKRNNIYVPILSHAMNNLISLLFILV